jgi:hypothetical protein
LIVLDHILTILADLVSIDLGEMAARSWRVQGYCIYSRFFKHELLEYECSHNAKELIETIGDYEDLPVFLLSGPRQTIRFSSLTHPPPLSPDVFNHKEMGSSSGMILKLRAF